ncbi:MAG: HAMP domain-containing protein [Deltaproteobacteria bacterium]|nr:HAMP domain-containing protein [Deltaproteobacteria bacterium]
MKPVTLAMQINRAFVWCMFIPMLAATVISIAAFISSAKNEAIGKIGADLKTALLLYHDSEQEMLLLAKTYSQEKAVSFLLPYAASTANVGLKVGLELARMARNHKLDMVTVVGLAGEVIACSHAPYQAKGTLLDKDYIRVALLGIPQGFTERITREELLREGITLSSLEDDMQAMLSLTGVSPIYNSDQNQIIGAVILKKFIGNTSDLAEKITGTIGLHVVFFENIRLVSKARPTGKTIEFISPSRPVLESVYDRKQIVSTASFYRGGHLSIHSPILDIDGVPVGILMLQSGVQTFIRGRDTIVTTLVVLFSIGFLLLYLLRKFLTRQVIDPIYSLKASAEEIGKGRYESVVEIISHNEIGALTEAFNEMALRLKTTHSSLDNEIRQHHQSEIALQQAHDELERRVDERTADLSASNSQLKLEIEERQAVEERFRSALAEKEILLKEVHHRVKNNLQIISSLLDMNRSRCADQQVSDTLSGACARIHTMAMIHNQLYQSSRFDRINMQDYIRELSTHLSHVYGKANRVSMDIRVENITLSLIQAMPCALIFNELISNSFKHAFKPDQAGTIAIFMSVIDDAVSVRFQDNGVGIPEDMDLPQAKSLGMKLINNLVVKQLKGTLRICRNPGTEIVFGFRIS